MLSYRVLLPLTLLLSAALVNAQPQQALTLNQQGVEAAARRDFAEAERSYRAAVDLYRALGASYEAHLSITLFNLAETICGEGRWRESAEVFRESLALTRRSLGPKSLRTAAGLNALANVEMMLGDFDSAEERFFTESVAIGRELYARDIQLAQLLTCRLVLVTPSPRQAGRRAAIRRRCLTPNYRCRAPRGEWIPR